VGERRQAATAPRIPIVIVFIAAASLIGTSAAALVDAFAVAFFNSVAATTGTCSSA